jgi:hypothetical protein
VKFAAALFLATVASAQQVPKSACDFDGFDINSQLAEVKAAATAYYGCGTGKCISMTLKPGDPVVISRTEGPWTCGYLVGHDGSAQGWLRTNDLRPITPDPNPPLDAWIGKWIQDDNHITIRRSQDKLAVDGKAYWFGPNHSQHSGEISAEAETARNRIHYEDGLCKVEFALITNYLLANDNNMCGGMNVRFWGVWRRVTNR